MFRTACHSSPATRVGATPHPRRLPRCWRGIATKGMATAYFAIGGADGHADGVLDRAESRIAFGSATWPHMLFRAMLAEQLYRAMMILAGHPYHRGG